MKGSWVRVDLGSTIVWVSVNYRGNVIVADEPFSENRHVKELVVLKDDSIALI